MYYQNSSTIKLYVRVSCQSSPTSTGKHYLLINLSLFSI